MSRRNILLTAFSTSLVVIFLIGLSIYTTTTRSGKLPVDVNVVPSDAIITIGGAETTTDGTVYLQEGEYNIEVSRSGFETISQTVHIDQNNKVLTISLAPESEEAQRWAQDNQELYLQNERLSGEASAATGEAFRNTHPIVNSLPYENLLYTIGYRADPADPTGNSIILEIDAPEGYRQAAIYQIYQLGFDPTDYKINFSNYTNPFTAS